MSFRGSAAVPPAKQDRDLLVVAAITRAEILYGGEMLPAGKRHDRLPAPAERLFADELRGRILPFGRVKRNYMPTSRD